MSRLKEVNFWLLFFIISAIILVISFLTFYSEWNSLKNKYVQQLYNTNQITSQNTLSFFYQQETIFKILGNVLIKADASKYPESSRETIKNMVKVNKSLVGFGLASYDGQLLLVSNIKENKKLPNLMKNEKTKASFEKARENTSLMLGRTYLLKASNTWGMPIRMAVEDNTGKIPFVLTAGISLDGGTSALNIKELPPGFSIQVVRSDGFIQFQNPINHKNLEKVYNEPFDKSSFFKVKKMKNEERVLFDSFILGKDTLSSAMYLEDFDLYTIVSVPYEILIKEYFYRILAWFVLLVVTLFVLFIIFKYSIDLQKNASNKLKFLARHDSLTALPNRLALYEEIDKKIERKEEFYLFFIDLDNFKFVNDNFGHVIGDELLKYIASMLKRLLLKGDYLARQSGDEFILLVNESEHEPIRNLAKKILSLFSKEIILNDTDIFIGSSIGIAKCEKEDNTSELIKKADIALNKAKERKNTYVFFTDEIYKESKAYLDIELNLRKALKNNEFSIVYQPKISSISHTIVGVEALLRWKNDVLGFVSPEIFISIAEKSGFINEIGEYVVKNAQKDILEVWEKTSTKFSLSVNVSPRQIATLKDMNKFKELIDKSDFPKNDFIIEVTENIFIRESYKTIEFLKELRSISLGVSLDDFGTGYSSLSILSKLPITELKIDKSFIQNMLLNEDNLMLVKSIINIARNMRLKVVAEGVEKEEELRILDEMACQIYQGYYFSKPLSKDELINFVNNRK